MFMIKLFHTLFGYYVYDAYVNKIAQITSTLYDALEKKDYDYLNASVEFQTMKLNGFFDDADFEMCVIDEDLFATMYQRALRSITLQVTQNCNFRCTYCPYTGNVGHERVHSNKRMSLDTAISAIDFLHDHSIDSEVLVVGFYGGEPLLEFSLIKTTMEYAKKRFAGKDIIFAMTTNATLLDEEKIKYLDDNNVSLMISLDGPKEVNDAHRLFASNHRGTFDFVIQKLELIATRYPNLRNRTTINVVVDPGLDYREYKRLFDNETITSKFAIRSQLIDNTGLEKTFPASDEFIKYMRYFDFINVLWANNKVDVPDYRGLLIGDSKWGVEDKYKPLDAGPIIKAASPSGPCIPGFMKLFVDVDGQFLPCEKTSELHSVLNIGDLQNGFKLDKCKALVQIPMITEKECKACFAFRFCDSCCVFASSKEGLDRNKRLSMCSFVKRRVEGILERYALEHRHTIRKYV